MAGAHFVVSIDAITGLTSTTATSGGTIDTGSIYTMSEIGIVYGLSINPTINSDTKIIDPSVTDGAFVSDMTGLTPSTTYHARTYVLDTTTYCSYSGDVEFTTDGSTAIVLTTTIVTDIIQDGGVTGGEITNLNGLTNTERGVVCGLSTSPTIDDIKFQDGSTGLGSFVSYPYGLTALTTYYVRAYAIDSTSTVYYGDQQTFITASVPTVVTLSTSAITTGSIHCGAEVTSENGSFAESVGVCVATNTAPTTSDYSFGFGTGVGSFTGSAYGLLPGTLYYLRAYATNTFGTSYGDEVSFTTLAGIPTLTTTTTSTITQTTSTSGGDISSDGGATVTARGVCWSTSASPTTALSTKTTDGTGTGTFASSITGLIAHTLYYVRSYATNSAGTAYGDELSFTTLAIVPLVLTLPTFTFTRTTAILRAIITSDRGLTVTSRSIYWGTTSDPLNDGTQVIDPGEGIGYFELPITGLLPGTLIYVQASAVNANGQGLGEVLSFTTIEATIPTIVTKEPSSPVFSLVSSGGTMTDDNGSTVDSTGIVWSLVAHPTLEDNVVGNTSDNYLPFDLSFGSDPSQLYYIRAYATNSVGTAYGNEVVIQSDSLNMKPQWIEKPTITNVVPFLPGILFDNSCTISQTQVAETVELFPNKIGAQPGNGAMCRLFGDGSTTPTFSPRFKMNASSAVYDTTLLALNLVLFLFDGIDYWYTIVNTILPS
jgi:hypothetical protein